MTTVDVRFKNEMIDLLKSMIGKPLIKLRCDPLDHDDVAFMNVGLYTPEKTLLLQCDLHEIDYYGFDEEVTYFEVFDAKEEDIRSGYLNGVLKDVPIGRVIREIHLVEENQRMYDHGKLTYSLFLDRGIGFVLDDGTELAFEKMWAFGEEMRVHRGHNPEEQFHPVEEEMWVNDDGSKPELEIERSIVVLK